MNNRIYIQKILFVAAWALLCGGILTLLVAANSKEQKHLCKEVVITVKGVGESFYVDKNDISSALKKAANGKLVNQSLRSINLAKLEKSLERNAWIRDAELYVDSKDVLHVTVTERQPIARVFTTRGASFYMDSSGLKMPLLQRVSIRVPVVTNYTAAKKLNKADSILLTNLKQLLQYVNHDPFWSAQVGQIDIVDRNKFEIIPTIGNHIIRIGNAENLEQKFGRLLIFYRQVLGKTGFDKYNVLDARFNGQIVGMYKGAASAVDSIQLQKNIEELLQKSLVQQAEEAAAIDSVNRAAIKKATDTAAAKRETEEPPIKPDPSLAKASITKPRPIPPAKPAAQSKPIGRLKEQKPKAVMKRN